MMELESSNAKHLSRAALFSVIVVLSLIFGSSLFSLRQQKNLSLNFHASTRDVELNFEIYNDYTQKSPITGSPWNYLAEPYRETTLSVVDASDEEDRYAWDIEGQEMEGSSIAHTFTRLGNHPVVLTDTVTGEILSVNVMVKYVRREVRTLTDQDRTDVLDALEILYKLDTENGKKIYGEDYKGMDYFLKQHLDGAGRVECDHWHDDAGIMTHHVGFTLEVEQIMQLINPVVSMPYWDYSIDDYLYDDLSDSPLWQDDWLGSMAPENDLKIIDSGRWAYLALPPAGDYDNVNPYGLLRTVWNVNAAPYVTRYNYVNSVEFKMGVGCTELYTAFKKTTISELNEQLNGETHGPVHIHIGGEWGARGEQLATSEGMQANLALISKILWRAGYLRVPEECTDDDCSTSCPDDLYKKQGKSAYDVLFELGLFEYIDGHIQYDDENDAYHYYEHWNTKEEEEFFEAVLNAMCDPGNLGEMYTSAAPADPSFWFLHPAAERFLNLRRIVADDFPLDETWGYDHDSSVASDSGWVCDWTDVKESEMPKCVRSYDCSGHRAEDELEFEFIGNLVGRKFTNQDYYDFMHPFNEDLPYMYDNYDYDHCTEQGIDFFG